ncbi:hypothetical protein E1176_02430 [Fulvivirga sp. RKSG066]|nr:hypothetical protein [Fulvivirga aurantia]
MLQASLSFLALVFISVVFVGCGSDDGGDEPQPDLCADVTIAFDLNQTGCNEVTVENTTGGEGAYEFSIDGTTFQSSAEFSGVASGANSIIVRDANGCEATQSITIEEVNITFDLEQTGCDEITVQNITGGEGAYEFSIDGSTFQSAAEFSGVASGANTITARDANGCEATKSITIAEELSLTATADAYTITVEAAGGVGPFQYSIDDKATFQTETTFEVEEEKDYTIVVKDENGCEATVTVTADEVTTTTDSRDGQTYKVVKIGTQIWFASHFNYQPESGLNGYYDNDSVQYATEYGRLYSWTVAKEIAPQGWRLPTKTEFQELLEIYSTETEAAQALAVGGATNFNFVLSGTYYSAFDDFDNINMVGYLWSSSENESDLDRAFGLTIEPEFSSIELSGNFLKERWLSVRFVKE